METAQVKIEKARGPRRLAALQARFDALEVDARERLRKALGAGHQRLTELDEALAKVSREDWSMDGVRKRFDALRSRAEQIRANAMKRMTEMPGTAVSRLTNGTRVPVQNLAKELDRLAKLLEPRVEAGRAVEVPAAPEFKSARAPKQKVEA